MTTGLTVENVYLLLTLKLLGGSEVWQAICIETGRMMTAKCPHARKLERVGKSQRKQERARESRREKRRASEGARERKGK